MVLIIRTVFNNTLLPVELFVPGYDTDKLPVIIPAHTTVDLFTVVTGDQLEAMQEEIEKFVSLGSLSAIASVDTATFNPVGGGSSSSTSVIPITHNQSLTEPGFYVWGPGANYQVMLPDAATVAGKVFYLNALQANIITEYPIPTSNSGPTGICTGPDGNIWFVENNGNKIGKITTAGTVLAEYPIPTPGSNSYGIATGPDNNLWFCELAWPPNNIGQCTTSGVISEYPVITPNSDPYDIVAGPDGNMWFTEYNQSLVANINPTTKVITEYPITTPGNNGPQAICVGPDGNIWFAQVYVNFIGTIDINTFVITQYPISSAASGICAGPDGNLWIAEGNGQIGKMSTSGVLLAEYTVPPFGGFFGQICAGADGNLWFCNYSSNTIGKITTSGLITQYDIPTPGSSPQWICSGPDNNIWFTEQVGQVGKLIPVNPPSFASVSNQTLNGVNITINPQVISGQSISIISDGSNWFTL